MSARLTYAPALDGVRAVAVCAVLLHHGQVGWAAGGFLGVDVFFVLSGYLITTLLVLEHRETGRIDLTAFWLRRARRLLPALLLVLVAVAGYAAALAPRTSLTRLRGDGLAALGYVANWRFVVVDESYFDQFSAPSPLRHMWSLAIEEQWYAVWPVLVVLFLSRIRLKLSDAVALSLLAAAGSAAIMAVLWDGADPSRVYYGTDARVQALLVGAALAFVLADAESPARRLFTGRAAGWLGLAGAVSLCLLIALADDQAHWLYVGGFTLVATASAAVVASAASGRGAVPRLLAAEPLRRLGVISYGVYLWHWPIYVVLTPDRVHLSGTTLLVTRIAVTLVAATVSYHLVERPIRDGALRLHFPQAGRRLAPAVFAGVAGLLVLATAGAQVQPTAVAAVVGREPAPTAPLPVAPVPLPTASTSLTTAPPAPDHGPARVFVLGDSVAFNLHTGFRSELAEGIDVRGSTKLGCGLVGGRLVIDGRAEPEPQPCRTWPAEWHVQAGEWDPDVSVVLPGIGELFDHEVGGTRLRFGSAAYGDYLIAELDAVVRVLATDADDRVALLTLPCHRKPDTGLDRTVAVVNDQQRHSWLNELLRTYAAARSDRVVIIEWSEFLCPGGSFVARREGVTLRPDGVHLSDEATALAWRWLAPRLREIADR